MRISDKEIKAIKEVVGSIDKDASIYLFGSRVYDDKKGGDIDLLILSEELMLLEHSNTMLSYSYNTCESIGIKKDYTFEELDKFEALTSRFARTSDVLIQKIFRLIDILELERPGSVIDRINRAEKRDLISSSEIFKEIRHLRNDIAHEYIPTAIEEIFKNVLELTPHLIDSVDRVKKYCKRNWGE